MIFLEYESFLNSYSPVASQLGELVRTSQLVRTNAFLHNLSHSALCYLCTSSFTTLPLTHSDSLSRYFLCNSWLSASIAACSLCMNGLSSAIFLGVFPPHVFQVQTRMLLSLTPLFKIGTKSTPSHNLPLLLSLVSFIALTTI